MHAVLLAAALLAAQELEALARSSTLGALRSTGRWALSVSLSAYVACCFFIQLSHAPPPHEKRAARRKRLSALCLTLLYRVLIMSVMIIVSVELGDKNAPWILLVIILCILVSIPVVDVLLGSPK